MYNEELQATFVRHIVQNVRDEVIRATDQAIAGQRRDTTSRHVHIMSSHLSDESREFIYQLIPYIVDGTIGVFLQQFDVHPDLLQLHFRKADGTMVNLLESTDGLEGEYSGSGWVEEYSEQRSDSLRHGTR